MRNGILTLMTSAVLMVMLALCSCEKMVTEENDERPGSDTAGNLILKVLATGTRTDAAPWKTLNFVLFQEGAKVKAVTQKEGDTGFGEVSMTLTPGTYQVMVLGHSSASNPSLSNPENVKFTNENGFSDTFVAYKSIVVEETAKTHEIEMVRASSMVRFKTNDPKPEAVKKVRFYYVGGSGAINVLTGYGVDKSKQTVMIDLPDTMTGQPLQFELYTFARTDDATLTLTVNMFDADGNLLSYPGMVEGARVFTDIPIKKNQITECAGNFFSANSQQPGNDNPSSPADHTGTSFVLIVNAEWGSVVSYNY